MVQRSDQKLCLQWRWLPTKPLFSIQRSERGQRVHWCHPGLWRWWAGGIPQGGSHVLQYILQEPSSEEEAPTPVDLHDGWDVGSDFLFHGEANENLDSSLAIAETSMETRQKQCPKNQATNMFSHETVNLEEGESFKPQLKNENGLTSVTMNHIPKQPLHWNLTQIQQMWRSRVKSEIHDSYHWKREHEENVRCVERRKADIRP